MAELKRSNVYGNLNLRSMTYPEVDDKGNPKKDSKGNIITKSVGPSFKTAATPKNSSGGAVSNSGASQWVESKDTGTGLIVALHDKLQDYLGRNDEISIGYYCGRKLQTAAEKTNETAIRDLLKAKSINSDHIEEYVNGYRSLSNLKTTANKTPSFTDKEKEILKKPPSSPWRADTEDIKDKNGKVTGQKAVINARLIGDHIKIFGRLKYVGEPELNGNLTNRVILRLQLKGMKGKKIKKIWKACGTCAGFGSASAIYVTDVQDAVKQRTSIKDGNKWTYKNTKFSSCPSTADPRTPESDGSIWIDIMLSAIATSTQKSDKFSFYINCPVTFEE